jgi:hypothetical protein
VVKQKNVRRHASGVPFRLSVALILAKEIATGRPLKIMKLSAHSNGSTLLTLSNESKGILKYFHQRLFRASALMCFNP